MKSRVVSDIVLSPYKRKSALFQARSTLQGIQNLAAFAPVPGLAACVPIVVSIIDSVDGARSNQEDCLRLAERATEIFYAIVNQTAERKENIPEELCQGINQLALTLESINDFIRRQTPRTFISKMWTYGGDMDVIKRSNIQLDNALSLFQLKAQIAIQRKLEVLRLLMEDRGIDGKSSTSPASNALGSSYLPPKPSIFYGREEVIDKIVKSIVMQDSANIAVLGPGGVGKTSLSLIILHHLSIIECFGPNRWFIQCEGSFTPQGLVSAIASRLDLSGDMLFERIILFFETQRTILVLDNFESPWETLETRSQIEAMLARLAAINT